MGLSDPAYEYLEIADLRKLRRKLESALHNAAVREGVIQGIRETFESEEEGGLMLRKALLPMVVTQQV